MTAGLKPYPAYRDSGLPWLGEVPSHWTTPRFKTIFREIDRRSGTGEEPLLSLRMERGLVDHHAVGGKPIPLANLLNYKVTRPGEIVMNRMRAAAGLFVATPKLGLVSPDYAVLRPRKGVELGYFVHLFRSRETDPDKLHDLKADLDGYQVYQRSEVEKLPAPRESDLAKGILEAIDMDSYRAEVRSALDIALADQDGEVEPVPTSGGGHLPEPELDRLSNILRSFNEQFGNIDWKDADKIRQVIAEEIPGKVAEDKAYQNAMKHSDRQNARIEHDKALQKVILGFLADHTELFKQFSDNPAFKKWLGDTVFSATYNAPVAHAETHGGPQASRRTGRKGGYGLRPRPT